MHLVAITDTYKRLMFMTGRCVHRLSNITPRDAGSSQHRAFTKLEASSTNRPENELFCTILTISIIIYNTSSNTSKATHFPYALMHPLHVIWHLCPTLEPQSPYAAPHLDSTWCLMFACKKVTGTSIFECVCYVYIACICMHTSVYTLARTRVHPRDTTPWYHRLLFCRRVAWLLT
jgi:hypothetical protein